MKAILKLSLSLITLGLMNACGNENPPSAQPPAPGSDPVAEARATINEENMDAYLDELEAQIAADETLLEE